MTVDGSRRDEAHEEAMSTLALSLAGVNMNSTADSTGQMTTPGVMPGGVVGAGGFRWKNDAGGFSSFSENLPAPSTPERRARGESIDLFLSRSPSQSLGNDLLQFDKSEAPSDPSHMTFNPGAYGFIPQQDNAMNNDAIGRRDISPTASVAGTSSSTCSRSQSPSQLQSHIQVQPMKGNIGPSYDRDKGLTGRRNISHASLASIEENYDGRPHRMQHHQQAQSFNQASNIAPAGAYGALGARNDDNGGLEGPSSSAPMYVPLQQPIHQPGSNYQTTQQTQQVFYMAMSTQDGRQVLQPVQVLQIPGQASPAVVLPTGIALNASASIQDQQVQGGMSTGQNMLVSPNAQGGSLEIAPPSSIKTFESRRPKARPTPHHCHQMQRVGSSGSGKGHHLNLGGHQTQRGRGDEDYNDQSKDVSPSPSSRFQEQYTQSHRNTPTSSRGPSPRSSPTPNDVIASLYAAPQRPPLDELLGNVRRLSRDQVGCRLLQQALDEEGPMAAAMILEEGLSFWGEAMVDPFGNYLFQKILEKITPSERVILVKSVSARLVNASLNLHGTRSVQKVVELCAADETIMSVDEKDSCEEKETAASILTRALTPAAARLCIDSHGNHVIQRILLKLPRAHSQFVFDAVAASVGDVARHRHGCCVIQRCLDSPPSKARTHLVNRIVEKALELMQDAYGNYVVQYVLDVCEDEDVHVVCESIVRRVNSLAIQKFSSNVVEKCLERSTDKVREQYLDELSDPDRIRELMMDPFGNYVIQRALSVATHAQATRLVDAIKPHLLSSQQGGQSGAGLKNTAGGRRILAKICRRFPNFNLGIGDEHLYQSQKHGYRQAGQHHHSLPTSVPSGHSGLGSSPKRRSFQGNHGNQHYRSGRGQQGPIYQNPMAYNQHSM